MKYIPSIAFEEMSGSAKGVTAAKTRGRKYIRNRGYGGGFKSSAQSAVNSIFKQLSQSWRALSNAQILSWNALANTQKGKSVLGTSSKISGANLYSRLNFWIVKSGGTAVSDPPALVGVDVDVEKANLSYRKRRRHTKVQTRKLTRRLLNLLGKILKETRTLERENAGAEKLLTARQKSDIEIITRVYRQQKAHFENNNPRESVVTGNQEYIKIGNEATSKIATIVHQKR